MSLVKTSERIEYQLVGQVLAELRDELGLSQRGLARKVGRTETAIWKIERGDQRLDIVELYDIAEALRIPFREVATKIEERIKTQAS